MEQASSILYQQAQDAVNNGDYKLAQEKITAIPEGYSISTQAKTLLVEIDQKVAEQERVENYAQAVSYYMMDSMIWHNLYLLDLKITAIQKNI